MPLDAAPTGLMLIKRQAIERIIKERPDLRINFEKKEGIEENSYLIFDARPSKDRTHYMSDDYGFSETWIDLGGKLWCYPDVTISHWWMTKNTGNVARNLEYKAQQQELSKDSLDKPQEK